MSLIRRDLHLFEQAEQNTVEQKIRMICVRLLLSATPKSKSVVEQRPVTPHVYRIGETDAFVATRSGDLHEHAKAMNLTLVNAFHFYLKEGDVVEVIDGKEFSTPECVRIKQSKAMFSTSQNGTADKSEQGQINVS